LLYAAWFYLPFRKRNAFACGECGVFANSLKRIGKWQSLWRRLAFAICHSLHKGLSKLAT
jgi:hypothetical protein